MAALGLMITSAVSAQAANRTVKIWVEKIFLTLYQSYKRLPRTLSSRKSGFGYAETSFSGSLFVQPASMPEMPHTRYYHRNTVFVRCVENFLIAHRACGVDDGFDALFGDDVHAVAEGEEGI